MRHGWLLIPLVLLFPSDFGRAQDPVAADVAAPDERANAHEVVVLRLKGLDCDECQPRAESEATSIEGVFQARANRAEGTLTVTFFTDKTDATEVESALASAGFEVAP